MFDKLLNLGCALDWITPLAAFLQDFGAGSYSDFGVPASPYWGRREIKRLLGYHGIRVWGLMYNLKADTLMFTVQEQQAELTYAILVDAGIPILYAPRIVLEPEFYEAV